MARLIASGQVLPRELDGYNARTELRWLNTFAASSKVGGGPWKTDSVKVKMPCTRALKPTFSTEEDAPTFEVCGVRYCSLVDLLVAKVQDPSFSRSFKYTLFTEWWYPPGSAKPIRIYGEAYSLDVAVQLYEEIKGIPPPPDHPQIESVVVMLMLGSDATHLADFGTASLWPIYVLFGNMSKYDRSRTSEFTACQLAYLPKVTHSLPLLVPADHPGHQLPDDFADSYKRKFDVPPPDDILTHCQRELYHAVVERILKGEFEEVYKNGIVILFPNGVHRRVFPWFYCYSVDYPKKYSPPWPCHPAATYDYKQSSHSKYQESRQVPLPTLSRPAWRGLRPW